LSEEFHVKLAGDNSDNEPGKLDADISLMTVVSIDKQPLAEK
jgi:hypothetical protein